MINNNNRYIQVFPKKYFSPQKIGSYYRFNLVYFHSNFTQWKFLLDLPVYLDHIIDSLSYILTIILPYGRFFLNVSVYLETTTSYVSKVLILPNVIFYWIYMFTSAETSLVFLSV